MPGTDMLVYIGSEPVGGLVPPAGPSALLARPSVVERDSVAEDPNETVSTLYENHALDGVVWTAQEGDSVESLFASHGYDYVDGDTGWRAQPRHL